MLPTNGTAIGRHFRAQACSAHQIFISQQGSRADQNCKRPPLSIIPYDVEESRTTFTQGEQSMATSASISISSLFQHLQERD